MRLSKILFSLIATAVVGCFAVLGPALGGRNPQLKVAIHVVPHGVTCQTLPSFTDCSQIATTYPGLGNIDVIPVFYDMNECLTAEFGLTWPSAWGTMSYSSCPGPLVVGGIVNPGEGLAVAWAACQYGWSLAPGHGWLMARSPGTISIIPNPMTGDCEVVDCAPRSEREKNFPVAMVSAGVGGVIGGNPCQTIYMPLLLGLSDGLGGHCAASGTTITYTISYSNFTNLVAVHDAALSDSLPSSLTFLTASDGGSYDPATRKVTWTLGTLDSAEAGSVQISASVGSQPGTAVTNRCRLTSAEAPATEASFPTVLCAEGLLPVNLTMDDGLGEGECVYSDRNVTYQIVVDNGPNSATVHNALLVDYLPEQTTFRNSTGGGVYNGTSRTVSWSMSTLAAGAQVTKSLTLTVTAPQGSSVTNSCELTSDDAPASQAYDTTNVCEIAAPLAITIDDGLSGACADNGDTLVYLLSYQNTMDYAEATGVVLTGTLPAGADFVSASSGGVFDEPSRTVTWAVGSLAPLEQGSCELSVFVSGSPGSLIRTGCAIACSEAANGSAAESTEVCWFSALQLNKTAYVASCVTYGDSITYTLSYGNTANNLDVHNVVLYDFMPGQTEFVSASDGGAFDGVDKVTWDLGTLAAGATGSQQMTLAIHVARGVGFTNQSAIVCSEVAAPVDATKSLRVCGGSERNPLNKIAIHVKAHPTTCKAMPVFTKCGDFKTTYAGCGDIDAIPVFFDLAEFTVVEFGLRWPEEWGTCGFTRCKGDLAIGGIVNSGDGIALAWTECQYSWAVAAGFAWLAAATPGKIRPIANPATGDIGVVNCAPSPGPYYDYPMSWAEAGVCGAVGTSPCTSTKLEPTTWGAIKALFK